MKLLLDTANLDEIKKLAGSSVVYGVTTNPSLMAKEDKGDYFDRIRTIAEILHGNFTTVKKHLSVEVITLDPHEMIDQAVHLHTMLKHLVGVDLYIKVPVHIENFAVITKLEELGIKVNATACMTAQQASLAAKAGASIVSFFFNRMYDGGDRHPTHEIKEFYESHKIWKNSLKEVNIICGSIRYPGDVKACWENGAQYVTVSYKVLNEMSSHPQTDRAIDGFQKDIDKWLE